MALTTSANSLNGRWIRKQVPVEVAATRVTVREVSYMALDKTFSGTVPELARHGWAHVKQALPRYFFALCPSVWSSAPFFSSLTLCWWERQLAA
jgi:hypothetical protein